MPNSVKDALSSEDPLSEEAIDLLLDYREEDTLVDYKVTFHNKGREWLEITKDVMAFSNTHGGYLVFGVKDGTFEHVGLDEAAVVAINDPNNLRQKINRYVSPRVELIRCKHIEKGEKRFVIVFVPPALDKTHIISKDASFTFPSGKEKVLLRQGTSYVRHSAGNHLTDARDLDDIISRRIDHFKESLLAKISRVVEAPQSSEVFVVSQDDTAEPHSKFIIQDGPDAIPIKGMSFTVVPKTTEQEISAWIAMTSRDSKAIPSSGIVWKWYKERRSLNLDSTQKLKVTMYSHLNGAPPFYWLRGCDAKDIKEMLLETFFHRPAMYLVGNIISTGAFLGKKFHKSLINRLGCYADRLAPAKRSIPSSGPRVFFGAENLLTQRRPDAADIAELKKELDEIAASVEREINHQPPLQSLCRAQTLDCFLYAQDDQYLSKKGDV